MMNAMDHCTQLRIVQFSEEIDPAKKRFRLGEEIQIFLYGSPPN
jgi:hypothetical protein